MTPEVATTAKSYTLHIGNLRLALRTSDALLENDVRRRYAQFLDDADADIHIDVLRLPPQPRFDSPYEFETRLKDSQLQIVSGVSHATIDFRARVGEVAIDPHERFGGGTYLENVLRQVCQPLALERGAFFLHAAGVVSPRGHHAQAFAGRSGAGKTTISQLFHGAGCRILSDDLVLIETGGDRCELASTPFFGTMREVEGIRSRHPLDAVNLLEKSDRNGLDPVANPAEATANVLINVPFTECFDSVYRQILLDAVGQLVATVPVRELFFRQDDPPLDDLGWQASRTNVEEGTR